MVTEKIATCKIEDEKKKNKIFTGLQKGFPIALGYLPLGFAFGILAQDYGMMIWQVALMSLLVFSGSGQFITVALLVMGVGFWPIVLTVMLVNVRYFLFSAAMSKYLRKISGKLTAVLTQQMTDETFVAANLYFSTQKVSISFWLALNMTAHGAWILATVLGAKVGQYIPDLMPWGLDFVLPAMFIALFFMTAFSKRYIMIGILAGGISLFFQSNGIEQTSAALATIIAAVMGVVINRWKRIN